MFRYIYPQFEKKRLLRGEMLEQLRDYPGNYIKLSYEGYGDGVLTGCRITWDRERLTVHPGMLLYRGHLYMMEKPYQMSCGALDRTRYLKVQFLAEERENESIVGNTRILLEEEKPDPACEMELCRFRLQEGARLRDRHEDFEDFSTMYDTVNLIHAPYAMEGGSTLHPLLLRTFAREMMKKGSREPLDLVFSVNVLSGGGHVSAECIQEYLYAKTGERAERNISMYRGLLEVLRRQKPAVEQDRRLSGESEGIMLL